MYTSLTIVDILRGYNVWESTASDTALSEFLGKVHANKDQVEFYFGFFLILINAPPPAGPFN